MCVIIHKPKGKTIPKNDLEKAFEKNEDGFGIVWRDNENNLHMKKGLFSKEQCIQEVENLNDYEIVVHFRKVSRGEKTEDNCHPFYVGNDTWMFHNGTITAIKVPDKDVRSDTLMFCEMILRNNLNIFRKTENGTEVNEDIRLLFDRFVSSDRLLFIDKNNIVKIGSWTEIDGVSFSNRNFIWTNYGTGNTYHNNSVTHYPNYQAKNELINTPRKPIVEESYGQKKSIWAI